MAAVEALSQDIANNKEHTVGKRKRSTNDGDNETPLVNGDGHVDPERVLELFQDLLRDLVAVLEDFDISTTILNVEILSTTNKDRTPKRAKLSSRTTTISSLVQTGAYTTVDAFLDDLRIAIQTISNRSVSANLTEKTTKFEEEVVNLLNDEIAQSAWPVPRSDKNVLLSVSSQKEDTSLATDENIVLSTAGFVYGSSQASKRLYSSFRLSAIDSKTELDPLPLDQLPNNITTTRTKMERVDQQQPKLVTLKDVFKHSKSPQIEAPRLSNTTARGPSITWVKQDRSRKLSRSKDRPNGLDSQIATGQWLSYSTPLALSQMPFAEARRKQRDRALSSGEANVELTQQEQETLLRSQQAYQQAKTDSLFKSSYSSFAPNHDNSDAIISTRIKGLHWWLKQGAAKYLVDTELSSSSPFEDAEAQEDVQTEEPIAGDDQIEAMFESWIDPELLGGIPKDKDTKDKEVDEILEEISEMLQTLSSYQRNRSLMLTPKQQGSLTPSKSVTELLGDSMTPSSSEYLLYETLRDSLTALIQSLPPYAVAKLNGEQLGQLSISTKMLVSMPEVKGSMTDSELQSAKAPTATATTPRPLVTATARPSISQQQVSTPTVSANQGTPRPVASAYSKFRPTVSTPGYTSYTSQPTTPRTALIPQSPSATPLHPMTNGTRPMMNGHSGYSSQASPPRPSSASMIRPSIAVPGQTYSSYNTSAVAGNAQTSSMPQGYTSSKLSQPIRAVGWPSTNGVPASASPVSEAPKSEEHRTTPGVQVAQMR